MQKKISSGLLLLSLILGGCYEDKGNYDYSTPNMAEVVYPEGAGTAFLGESHTIVPEIRFRNPQDTAGIRYFWILETDTLSTERNLEYVFRTTMKGRKLFHHIKDTRTGYTTANTVEMNVSSRYSKGWLALSEKDGKSVLTFISPNDDGSGYRAQADLFTFLRDEELGKGPERMTQEYTERGSLLTVIQQEGSVSLNGDTYEKVMPLEKQFLHGRYPQGFTPENIAYSGVSYAVLQGSDGSLYPRIFDGYSDQYNFFMAAFLELPLQLRGEPLHASALHQAGDNFSLILGYDGKQKRFFGLDSKTSYGPVIASRLQPCPEDADEETERLYDRFTDLDNLGDYDMHYFGLTREEYKKCDLLTVLRKGDEFKVQIGNWNMKYINPAVVTPVRILDIDSRLLSGTSCFQTLYKRPYVFFTNGGKLYWYDLNTDRTHQMKEYGSRITALDVDFYQMVLMVGLENGEVHIVDIATEHLTGYKELFSTSCPGRVVDVMFKYRNMGNWLYGDPEEYL